MVCATFQQKFEELAGGSIMFYTSFYEANSILNRNCLFSLGSRFRMKQGRATPNLEQCKQELKSLLMEVKEESEKAGFQHSENEDHGIWSHHFMGNRWGNSVRLYFWGLQNHWRW